MRGICDSMILRNCQSGDFVSLFGIIVCGVLVTAGLAFAETRFHRPVVKLANPKAYTTFKLDDNQFPVVEKASVAVTCITYRGTKRYYVEVGVVNKSDSALVLSKDFVRFIKPGYTVFLASTLESASEVLASVAEPFVPTPPPPPTRSTTTYSGTANTLGQMTTVEGTATTTVDNSAAAWHSLGQAIAARSYASTQNREQAFAKYIAAFAHGNQDLTIQPGRGGLFVFTFEQVKPKKAPFAVSVAAGTEVFEFRYKE